MHSLLQRQLKKHVNTFAGLSPEWEALLKAVSEAYEQSDADRWLVERSLELTSQELMLKHDALKRDLDARQRIMEELRLTNETLAAKMKQLEILNRAMLGREERILELKDEVRSLREQLTALHPTLPGDQEPRR